MKSLFVIFFSSSVEYLSVKEIFLIPLKSYLKVPDLSFCCNMEVPVVLPVF